MFEKTFAMHLGDNKREHAASFVVEAGFFCAFEVHDPSAEKVTKQRAQKLREAVAKTPPDSLKNFIQLIQKNLTPDGRITSYSAIFLAPSRVLSAASQGGSVLIRNSAPYTVLNGSGSVEGTAQHEDIFLLFTHSFAHIFPFALLFKSVPQHITVKELVQKIERILAENTTENTPKTVLAIKLTHQTGKQHPILKLPWRKDDESKPDPVQLVTAPTARRTLISQLPVRKIIFIIIALFLLIQAVVLIQRTIQQRKEQYFTQTVQTLMPQLQEISDNLFDNPSAKLKELENIKQTVVSLEKDYPNNIDKIKPLKQQLEELTKILGNAHITQEKIFFDLALIDEQARVNTLYSHQDTIALLDRQNKKVYIINTETKKHQTVNFQNKNPLFATVFDNNVYIFDKDKGVYKANAEGSSLIVPRSEKWGEVVDVALFNNNIYLLDRGRDEIFKFVPTNDGYSSEISYFQKGQSIDLSNAQNIAIDFSVYLLTSEAVWKYTSGAQDTFALDENIDPASLSRIHKAPGGALYALDPLAGRIMVFDKEGKLTTSVFNPKLKKTTYFSVRKDGVIIFLYSNILYMLDNF